MKAIFFTQFGNLLPFAMRARKNGHTVTLAICNAASREVGSGFVDTIRIALSPLTGISMAKGYDVAVFDHAGHIADEVRKAGIPTFGYTSLANRINSSPTQSDMILKLANVPLASDVSGMRVSISSWFNGSSPTLFTVNLISRHMMSGGLGIDVGCAGVISMHAFAHSAICDPIIRLSRILKKASYNAPITVHGILNEGEFKALRVEGGFIFEPTCALFEIAKGDIVEAMRACAVGETPRLRLKIGEVGLAIRLSVPPYPIAEGVRGEIPFGGYCDDNASHIWLRGVMMKDDPMIVAGWVGCVTARGEYLNEAKRRVYRTLHNLRLDEMQWRNDIGWERREDFEALTQSGLIMTRSVNEKGNGDIEESSRSPVETPTPIAEDGVNK